MSLRNLHRPDVSVFADVPLFAGYSRRDLAPLAPHADRVVVMPGLVLARAGRQPHEVVVILTGEVTVCHDGVPAGRLGPGTVVGAAEEIDRIPHQATYVAETAVSALVMTGPAFRCAVRSLRGLPDRLPTSAPAALVLAGAPGGAGRLTASRCA